MKSILLLLLLLGLAPGCATLATRAREEIARRTRPAAELPPEAPAPAPTPAPAPEYSRRIRIHGGGFLWKPISESDGRLVVLLPTELRGRIVYAQILSPEGQPMASGRFAGDTHNGNRPHYRFPHPGAHYGNNLTLRAFYADGSFRDWHIPEGAARVE